MTINPIWLDEFGDDYHKRNEITEVQLDARIRMWNLNFRVMAGECGGIPKTILEVGAGSGINLIAISKCYQTYEAKAELYAIEPNEQTRKMIRESASGIVPYDAQLPDINIFPENSMGMVFTSGVLIHLPKEQLLPAMKAMYALSSKYVVCIEYFSPERREVPYRGNDAALWSDDYGKIWMDNFKLRCVSVNFLWKPVTQLDNLTCWIFEKVN